MRRGWRGSNPRLLPQWSRVCALRLGKWGFFSSTRLPHGLWNGNALTSDDKFDASARDAGDFSIRNWLGILGGGASTNIIHTDMYGQIDIESTLDQAGILMLGPAPIAAAAGTLDTTLSSTNYQLLGDISANNGAAVAPEAAQYVLSNISFNIVRMDMPTYFYEAMANVLAF